MPLNELVLCQYCVSTELVLCQYCVSTELVPAMPLNESSDSA